MTGSLPGCWFSSLSETEENGDEAGDISDTRRNCLMVDPLFPKLVLGARGRFCPLTRRFADDGRTATDERRFTVALRTVAGGVD